MYLLVYKQILKSMEVIGSMCVSKLCVTGRGYELKPYYKIKLFFPAKFAIAYVGASSSGWYLKYLGTKGSSGSATL